MFFGVWDSEAFSEVMIVVLGIASSYTQTLLALLQCHNSHITNKESKRAPLFQIYSDSALRRSRINLIHPSCNNYPGTVGNTRCASIGLCKANGSGRINRPRHN